MNIDYTTWMAIIGSLAFACTAGMLAPFVTLRRESFSGDVTAHASLAGVFFMLAVPTPSVAVSLLIGGVGAAFIAHFFMFFLKHETSLSTDMILASTLSLFIGLALVLFTALVGHLGETASLNTSEGSIGGERSIALMRRYIFGSPASLLLEEAILLVSTSVMALLAVLCFYKIWLLFTFQQEWAPTLGFSLARAEFLFKSLFVTVVMVGILSVGALMVSAMFVAPSIAARVFTRRLPTLMIVSTMINISATSLALVLGTQFTGLPEGPVIIFIISSLAVIAPLSVHGYKTWVHRRAASTSS